MEKETSRSKIYLASLGLALGIAALTWGLLHQFSQQGDDHAHDDAQGMEANQVDLGVGSVLPNLSLKDLSQKSVKLSDIQGKVTLINFWATWCESCLVEMPSIQKLYDRYKDTGLQVIAVSLDEPSTVEEVIPLIKQLKLSFPVFIDPEQTVSELLSISAIPITLVVDSDRRIVMIENGEKNWFSASIQTTFESWLNRNGS